MPAYHEAFWIFIGTTGPIIALANVVTFGQATDAVVRLREHDKGPAVVRPGTSRGRAEFFRMLRLGHIYFVCLSFALSLTLTLLAAFSLWSQSDVMPGPWVFLLLIITFVLLFILGACSASFTRRLDDLRAARPSLVNDLDACETAEVSDGTR
jgi:hypothetical protein